MTMLSANAYHGHVPDVPTLLFELLGRGLAGDLALAASTGEFAMLAVIATAGTFFALTVASNLDKAFTVGILHPAEVRRRAERTVFLPLCDPGADGRPRPRAPAARRRAA